MSIRLGGRRIDTLRYGSGHWHGTLWQGKTLVDLERDHLHRETVRELGSASGSERLTERRSYDPLSRLSGFTLKQGGKRLRERRYQYDLTGNLTHIDDSVRGSISYTYDPLGQLLSAVQPGLTETFAFDPAGNLLDPDTSSAPIDTRKVLRELDEQPSPGASTLPVRLAKVTHNLLRQYMGYAYEYDSQGNTVVKRPRVSTVANEEGTLTFAYDAENRMTTAVRTFATSRIVARYSYDAFGRRIAKRVDEQPGNRVGRGVPDVAGNASPATGYRVRVDYLTYTIGGTSAVSPLRAGLVALLNQKLAQPVGWLNPLLYGALAGSGALRDITTGDNGGYAAQAGWDACTGWGVPVGKRLLAALAG